MIFFWNVCEKKKREKTSHDFYLFMEMNKKERKIFDDLRSKAILKLDLLTNQTLVMMADGLFVALLISWRSQMNACLLNCV